MTLNNEDDVGLLIMPEQKSIVPVALSAFQVTQSTRRKLKEYNHALLIKKDGSTLRIKDIQLHEFWGASVSRKVLSALTGARRIEVTWETIQSLELGYIKQLICECILLDSQQDDPFLPQKTAIDEVISLIQRSYSISEILLAIDMPSTNDCLDVL